MITRPDVRMVAIRSLMLVTVGEYRVLPQKRIEGASRADGAGVCLL